MNTITHLGPSYTHWPLTNHASTFLHWFWDRVLCVTVLAALELALQTRLASTSVRFTCLYSMVTPLPASYGDKTPDRQKVKKEEFVCHTAWGWSLARWSHGFCRIPSLCLSAWSFHDLSATAAACSHNLAAESSRLPLLCQSRTQDARAPEAVLEELGTTLERAPPLWTWPRWSPGWDHLEGLLKFYFQPRKTSQALFLSCHSSEDFYLQPLPYVLCASSVHQTQQPPRPHDSRGPVHEKEFA